MIIYKIQNRINNKIYIGQTVSSLKKRMREHKNSNKKYPMYKAIKKYGIENFDIRIIDTAKDINELNELEVKYIKKYDCIAPNGYNLTVGGRNKYITEETKEKVSKGNKNKSVSKETRKKLSIACSKEKNGFYGKHHTKEAKREMSQKALGRFMPESTRKKISIALKGRKMSQSFREKTSERTRGSKNPMALLTENQVEKVRWTILHKIKPSTISKIMKVSLYMVYNIRANRSWSYTKIPTKFIEELESV